MIRGSSIPIAFAHAQLSIVNVAQNAHEIALLPRFRDYSYAASSNHRCSRGVH